MKKGIAYALFCTYIMFYVFRNNVPYPASKFKVCAILSGKCEHFTRRQRLFPQPIRSSYFHTDRPKFLVGAYEMICWLLPAPYNTPFFYNSLRKSQKYFSTSIAVGEVLAENTSQVFSFTLDGKKSVLVPAAVPRHDKIYMFRFQPLFYFKGWNKTALRKENIQLETALRFMQ